MILQERHTNLKSATAEAHKHAKDKKKTHYVSGAKGSYRVSEKQPDGGRHISVTPKGNEWSCACDKDGCWTKSRLGMISMGESKLGSLVSELDEMVQSFDEVLDANFEWLTEDFYVDSDFLEMDLSHEKLDILVGDVVDGIDAGMSEEELVVLTEKTLHGARKALAGAKRRESVKRVAKKIVRGGFKAHAKVSKVRKQIKKAGGAKSWAKKKIKSKAKRVVGGAKKRVKSKLRRSVSRLKKWAHG